MPALEPFSTLPALEPFSTLQGQTPRRRQHLLPSEKNFFTEMGSGSEAGSNLRPMDFVYHSTLGLRVMKKKKKSLSKPFTPSCALPLDARPVLREAPERLSQLVVHQMNWAEKVFLF